MCGKQGPILMLVSGEATVGREVVRDMIQPVINLFTPGTGAGGGGNSTHPPEPSNNSH